MPQGKVKWFSTEKAFGFIEQDNDNDIFVHVTGLADGVTAIDKDMLVEYEVDQGRKGPQATNVKPVRPPPRRLPRPSEVEVVEVVEVEDEAGDVEIEEIEVVEVADEAGDVEIVEIDEEVVVEAEEEEEEAEPTLSLLTGRPPEDRSGSGGRPVVFPPPG